MPKTREDYNRERREKRKLTNNLDTHLYEKTIKGFLVRKYRNMESRIKGIQKKKFHLYKGKCLLDREEFYKWSLMSKEFDRLFKEWELSNYNQKLTPSVDRVNPSIGYELSNMEWVTNSENSRRSSITRKLKLCSIL